MACVLVAAAISVVPSGAARATYSAAIEPLAPVRFSYTTGWPIEAETLSPTRRATRSSPGPGGNGMTMVMGLLGCQD